MEVTSKIVEFEKIILRKVEDEETGIEKKIPYLYTLEFDVAVFMNEFPCSYCKNLSEKHTFTVLHNQIWQYCSITRFTTGPIGIELDHPWIKVKSKKKLSKGQLIAYLHEKKITPEPHVSMWLMGYN